MSGVTSLAVRVEQCLAFGRSGAWILAHLPCTEADIVRANKRMAAAAAGDNAAWVQALLAAPEVRPGETWHGTIVGYDRHRRRGEHACPDCSAARTEHTTAWRRERRRERQAAS